MTDTGADQYGHYFQRDVSTKLPVSQLQAH